MKALHTLLISCILLVLNGCGGRENILFSFRASDARSGVYSKTELAKQWKNPRWENGVSQGLASIVDSKDSGHGKILKVLYPKGTYSNSAVNGKIQWIVDLAKEYDEVYFTFDVKFDDAFDFVKGGKLHGLAGGTRNSGGKKPSGTDGFSCRVVWLPGGRLGQYIYHPDQPSKYGEVFKYGSDGKDIIIERGRWYRIANRMVLNTPGKHDGLVQAWIDGKLVQDIRNLKFRDIDSIGIDTFYFTTFFGGDDETYATVKDEYTYFDNFVISTGPINFNDRQSH